MPHLTLWQIEKLPWYSLLVVWIIAGSQMKRTKRMEPASARLFSAILLIASCFLLFSNYFAYGALSRRLFPGTPGLAWMGVALTFAGAAIANWARIILGENWSARVTLKVGHELIRSGPYRYVRHPIYTGILIAMAGTAIVVGELRGVIALALTLIVFGLKAQREEQFLATEFGDGYREYRKRTGFLVPGL